MTPHRDGRYSILLLATQALVTPRLYYRRSLCYLLILLLLSGCAAWRAPQVVTIREPVEVKIAVPVPCLAGELPPRPALLSDEDLTAMGDYAFVLGLRRNGLALDAYSRELEALLSGCRMAPGV